MKWVALVLWAVTALGGFVLLAAYWRRGGLRDAAAGNGFPITLFGHFPLAAAGLGLWIAYLVTDVDVLVWAALALLIVVAGLGFTMFTPWARARFAGHRVDRLGEPAGALPVPVVPGHGLLGAATIAFIVLSAPGVTGSS